MTKPLPRPACLPHGANIAAVPGLDYNAISQLWANELAFVSMCMIQQENEGIDYLNPTHAQRIVARAYHRHRWNMVVKYRQAKITTISVLLMLRDCMYLEGVKGLLVAERQETAEDVFERILLAYRRMPPSVRMPLEKGRKPGVRALHFCHGGNIKIITAGSKSPAVGRSIDRMVITEFGEAQWQRNAAMQIFPTISNRPNARIILESTTGLKGSHFELMWRKALEGRGRFNPVFLKWWEDNTKGYPDVGRNFKTNELALLESLPGCTRENLAFRQDALDTEFVGEVRLFQSKYPPSPYKGWRGSAKPVLPAAPIERLLESAREDPPENEEAGLCLFRAPIPSHVHVLIADPAGYGDVGDNSALALWDVSLDDEIGVWEGREDPGIFARRIKKAQDWVTEKTRPKKPTGAGRKWQPPTIRVRLGVESNAAACIATLVEMGARHILRTSRNHPGWYATERRLYEAEAKAIKALRADELSINSRGTLHQLLDYDGTRKKRKRGKNGEIQHFDRARTVIMYVDITRSRKFVQDAAEEGVDTDGRRSSEDGIPLSELGVADASENPQISSPYGPPPAAWM